MRALLCVVAALAMASDEHSNTAKSRLMCDCLGASFYLNYFFASFFIIIFIIKSSSTNHDSARKTM